MQNRGITLTKNWRAPWKGGVLYLFRSNFSSYSESLKFGMPTLLVFKYFPFLISSANWIITSLLWYLTEHFSHQSTFGLEILELAHVELLGGAYRAIYALHVRADVGIWKLRHGEYVSRDHCGTHLCDNYSRSIWLGFPFPKIVQFVMRWVQAQKGTRWHTKSSSYRKGWRGRIRNYWRSRYAAPSCLNAEAAAWHSMGHPKRPRGSCCFATKRMHIGQETDSIW